MLIGGTRIPVWLLIVYILSLLAILAWPVTAFMSVFAFDAPGSESQASAWEAVGIAVCWPILPLAGVAGSFFAYKGGARILAYALAVLAVLPLAAIVAVIFGSSIMSLIISMGGKF